MEKIKIAIIGVGNCASSLIQGIHYYNDKNPEDAIGLMNWDIGGYKPYDVEVVAAIDIDKRKVGKDVSERSEDTRLNSSHIPLSRMPSSA